MDVLRQILQWVVTPSIVVAGLVYLAQRVFEKFLDSRVEKYKNNLNLKTEEFKSNLKILELEYQIKYNKLHEERAVVIKTLNSKIIDLQKKLTFLTTRGQGPEWATEKTRDIAAGNSLNDLKDYFILNRIFFVIDFCDRIDSIINESTEIINEMSLAKRAYSEWSVSAQEKAYSRREWFNLSKKVDSEINKARLDCENQFRKLIGVL